MKNICVVCGKRFETARSDARYCSNACAKKASRSGKTAKKEKELAEIAYQQAHAQEIARQRREKEREEREWQKFLKEYNAFCEKENAKQQVRDRVSQIVSAVKQKAEEREEYRRMVVRECNRAYQGYLAVAAQENIPDRYKEYMRAYKGRIVKGLSQYLDTHHTADGCIVPIRDKPSDNIFDKNEVSFYWFSFMDKVTPYWYIGLLAQIG